ncbi:MAG: sulfatase-like hydrolase/transferase [Candidatus Thorarchaeota archaeon]
MEKSKPNIIIMLTDQQRYDTCGCYGQELNVTPNLDRLAKDGILFEYAFTNQPVCGPARSILQSGKYPTETGCYRNAIGLLITNQNIADHLSKMGYEVAYIGKWHLASTLGRSRDYKLEKRDYRTKPIPLELRGGYKDYWLASDVLEHTSHAYDGYLFDGEGNKRDFTGYRVDRQTDFILEYLESRKNQKPLFLFISFLEPHHQNDHNAIEGPIGSKEKFKNYKIPGDLQDTKGDWDDFFPEYLGCCHSIDMNLGRIIEKLKKLNKYEDSLIVFTSDHRCHFKTRTWEYKRSCHDASIRIPLIIKGTGFTGGRVINELVSLIDLPPTILKAAGTNIPNFMKGNTLQTLLDSSHNIKKWPQEVFIQISESQVGRAIRTKKWKYSVVAPNRDGFLYAKSDRYEEEYLYDLENDVYERQNVIKDPALKDIRRELAEILKRKMREVGEEIPLILPKGD